MSRGDATELENVVYWYAQRGYARLGSSNVFVGVFRFRDVTDEVGIGVAIYFSGYEWLNNGERRVVEDYYGMRLVERLTFDMAPPATRRHKPTTFYVLRHLDPETDDANWTRRSLFWKTQLEGASP